MRAICFACTSSLLHGKITGGLLQIGEDGQEVLDMNELKGCGRAQAAGDHILVSLLP
jgi:hypothetical protein